MLRAQKSFEKQGISVMPAPCCFLPVYAFDRNDFLPGARAINWNERLVHEWAGLMWYWLRRVV